MCTVQIASDGQIGNSVVDRFEFNPVQAYEASLTNVSGDVYAIAYAGSGIVSDGYVATVTIDAAGQIGNSVIDSLEFDTGLCWDAEIIQVSGDIYAAAYQGPATDGFIKSFQIDAAGQISNAVIDSLEFDTNQGMQPVILNAGGGVFMVAYSGPGTDGWLISVQIDDVGQIGNTVIDSFEFEGNSAADPSMVSIGSGIYANAYRGPNNDGFVETIALQ